MVRESKAVPEPEKKAKVIKAATKEIRDATTFSVANVTNAVTNESKVVTNAKEKTKARVAKWQKLHREEYNAKMREYRKSHGRSGKPE
jgi:2C-methyl-D-erythritol 2,4-cyclodiphosphate synthase